MNKIPIILTLILLITPTTLAEDRVLNVVDNRVYKQNFPNQLTTSTYQFSLNNLFFNITNISGDDGIWKANIRSQIIEEGDISTNNRYLIQYFFNNTWSVTYEVNYIRHSFGRWERLYDFTLFNGSTTVEKCITDDGLFLVFGGGTFPPPNPYIEFDYALHGKFGTSPSLDISFGDANYGDTTCNLPTSIGGGIQIIMTELTTVPSVKISTFDSELYTHSLIYSFDTKAHEIQARDTFNNETAQGCEQTFIIFGFCNLVNGLEAGITFIFSGIGFVTEKILGRIPFVGIIFQLVGQGFQLAGELIVIFLSIFFITNGQYGIGDIFWFHVVYLTSWGCIITAFTGNPIHIFKTPFWFVYWTGFLLWHFFKFIFWTLPIKAWELITALLPG